MYILFKVKRYILLKQFIFVSFLFAILKTHTEIFYYSFTYTLDVHTRYTCDTYTYIRKTLR